MSSSSLHGKKHACSTCGDELCVDGLWYTSVETATAPPHANRPPPQPKKRAHDRLQVCSKCRTSRADAAELQILFPRHEPYGTSVQLAALEKSRIAAALQVASNAHEQAQDEVALAAKLAEAAADAEADAQADAALAQVAAEEKAAAAAAELLKAQAVKSFNDAFSAVKAQDLEAERREGPFDDSKNTLADLKLRFPIGAQVRRNAQCPSWQPKTALDADGLFRHVKRTESPKHLEAEFINIRGHITVRDNTKFGKSWNRQPIPPGQFGIVEGYYQNHAVKVHDPSFEFHDHFKRSIMFHGKHLELVPAEAEAEVED